ncbi:MAG: putative exonuclease [Prokaryotic dsDNA virus sp.]|nr:MAG: putative exonuclease [Prokaryotic dsDNA virus sp.]
MKIHNVEQNTDEWYALRSKVATASEMSNIITTQGKPSASAKKYAYDKASSIIAGKPLDKWEGNRWTDRGHELEEEARSLYEFEFDCDVQLIGFITNDEMTAGCSPDGLVGDDGMMQIKCLKNDNHMKVLLESYVTQKVPTDYFTQCQCEMWVAERKWNDLWFYHPDLRSFRIRVERDDEFIKCMESEVSGFKSKVNDAVLAYNGAFGIK